MLNGKFIGAAESANTFVLEQNVPVTRHSKGEGNGQEKPEKTCVCHEHRGKSAAADAVSRV